MTTIGTEHEAIASQLAAEIDRLNAIIVLQDEKFDRLLKELNPDFFKRVDVAVAEAAADWQQECDFAIRKLRAAEAEVRRLKDLLDAADMEEGI